MDSRYKLLIAYDGTRYCGWQVQPNGTSIQTLVEKAISTALHHPIKVIGSGRTDAGVHALEQVAHFSFEGIVDLEKLHYSLNGLLPPDIRIMGLSIVSEDFHARYSAKGKIYHYYLHTSRVQNPFKRLYTTHILYPIDRDLLKRAAALFIGEHDFTAFSNEAHRGSASRDAVRTITRIDVIEDGNEIRLEFEADGFLYKMVRNIMGTILDVSRGKIDISQIPLIFEAKDRRKGGTCAPPQGLFLIKVIY
ncbi:MAG: tRNA pseudouridine(38-40) synthase TruA [Verrucomicrobia bacterium]|nr:tRNA pseudouridine(38-40) synthase TruA [Verrucomicrobiota bacterium]